LVLFYFGYSEISILKSGFAVRWQNGFVPIIGVLFNDKHHEFWQPPVLSQIHFQTSSHMVTLPSISRSIPARKGKKNTESNDGMIHYVALIKKSCMETLCTKVEKLWSHYVQK
jgi:hypothetical protein